MTDVISSASLSNPPSACSSAVVEIDQTTGSFKIKLPLPVSFDQNTWPKHQIGRDSYGYASWEDHPNQYVGKMQICADHTASSDTASITKESTNKKDNIGLFATRTDTGWSYRPFVMINGANPALSLHAETLQNIIIEALGGKSSLKDCELTGLSELSAEEKQKANAPPGSCSLITFTFEGKLKMDLPEAITAGIESNDIAEGGTAGSTGNKCKSSRLSKLFKMSPRFLGK